MTVTVSDALSQTMHDGRTYSFCSAGCLASFQEDPNRYLTPAG